MSEGVTATATLSDKPSVQVVKYGIGGSVEATWPESPPVSWLLKRMGVTVSIVTRCRLPISAGFGLSAAALLSTALAAGTFLDPPLSLRDAAALAHETEVVHRTGFGDVAASMGGGMECRLAPGTGGRIRRWAGIDTPLCAVSISPIDSPTVLTSESRIAAITGAWPGRCPEDLDDFFRLSRKFARDSGLLLPEVEDVLRACDEEGVPASMTMLGNGVFAAGEKARDVLARFGRVYEFRTATDGAHLLQG